MCPPTLLGTTPTGFRVYWSSVSRASRSASWRNTPTSGPTAAGVGVQVSGSAAASISRLHRGRPLDATGRGRLPLGIDEKYVSFTDTHTLSEPSGGAKTNPGCPGAARNDRRKYLARKGLMRFTGPGGRRPWRQASRPAGNETRPGLEAWAHIPTTTERL